MDKFIKLVNDKNYGTIIKDVNMSKHTTYKTGGTCAVFVEPNSKEDIKPIVDYLVENNIKFFVIGNGSNIILPDGFHNVVIIKLTKICEYYIERNYVCAGAGILVPKLSLELAYEGISGFEFASGIPGTLGGCVFMNAGAYGLEMKDILKSVLVYDYDQRRYLDLDISEITFSYRHSIFQEKPWIVLEAKFKYEVGEKDKIVALINDRRRRRVETQPIGQPSAGSVFKNFDDVPVWKVIDECGLREYTVGGAVVSPKHCNMIINSGGATSTNIVNLINQIEEIVYEKTNRKLVLEQRIIKWDD